MISSAPARQDTKRAVMEMFPNSGLFELYGATEPCCCVRRAASPSHTAVVHEILQRGPYASILGEGYAGLARRRADRAHSLPPSSRRAAPPIYPDLIYDRHRGQDQFDRLGSGLLRRFPSTDEGHDILPRSSPHVTKQDLFQKVPRR